MEIVPLAAVFAVHLLLAIPATRKDGGAKELVGAALKILATIGLPLFFFFLSVGLLPDWKGAAIWGWLDGFHLGKLALTPLVLWAVAAAWTHEVWQPERTPRWVTLGYAAGALASGMCAAIGFLIVPVSSWPLLSVPVYTAVYYGWRATRLLRDHPPGPGPLIGTLGGSLPFVAGSLLWAHQAWSELPDDPPSCFVVTAASAGHPALVGPFVTLERGGRRRRANRQLLTFWALEARWQARAPASHRAARRLYSRLGPAIARRMQGRWRADLLYLLLKPAEWGAAAFLRATPR